MLAVVIVGGGAAGCEFAWGLAQRDVAAMLLTTSLDTLYPLPRDRWRARAPHGTLWAQLADEAAVGEPFPDGSREYRAASLRRAVKRELERAPSLRVVQSNAVGLLREGERVVGVHTWEGPSLRAEAVVLAVGSFLHARLHIGSAVEHAGRLSEMAYDDLYQALLGAGVAFLPDTLTLAGDARSPGYRVDYQRFAPDALHGPQGAAALRGLPGCWALGACAAPLGVEEAASAGLAFAQAWPNPPAAGGLR